MGIFDRLARLSRSTRYALVGVIAFIVGGAGVVQAADPVHLSQIVNFAPNPDGTFNTAQVDGAHQLSVSDSGAQARLDTANRSLGQLKFDTTGNLQTAINGTPTVNLPRGVLVGIDPSSNAVSLTNQSLSVTGAVSVNGTVAVRAAIPNNAISFGRVLVPTCGGGPPICVAAISQSDSVGTQYAINSVALSGFGGTAAAVELEANCSPNVNAVSQGQVIDISAPAGQTVQLSFPQPIVLGGGQGQNCLQAIFLTGTIAWIGVTGYRL